MLHPSLVDLRAIGPLLCQGGDKAFTVMEVVISANRVQFRKHFFDRDTGKPSDKRFAQNGRRKLVDQSRVISLDTMGQYMNFIDFLAGERGVETPACVDLAFYDPISAVWERESREAA